jgi:hypothetical protein
MAETKRDLSLLLCSLVVPTVLLSWLLPAVSVHTYCENRLIAAVFGVTASVLGYFLLRNKSVGTARKVVRVIGVFFCLVALLINSWFIVYATRLCHRTAESLEKLAR